MCPPLAIMISCKLSPEPRREKYPHKFPFRNAFFPKKRHSQRRRGDYIRKAVRVINGHFFSSSKSPSAHLSVQMVDVDLD
ncbi:hypothetical protein CEXT_812481 [Caerostris extrusa]|uniref:Uncharacterized protein n=1 Tax=Caerostris extrusa TaxID=172846 RepID=A0AAV4T8Q7_CAEEX|nr:hypothetical protein CEXT_812481 [Caerostris extrusa]